MLDINEMKETYERLKVYPSLLEKVKEMLDIIEQEEVESIDDLEEALIPEVRGFGKEIVQTWACTKEGVIKKDLENKDVPHHSKKNCIGIPPLEK